MKPQHTLGPWEVDVRLGITARVNGGNRLVAIVYPTPVGDQRAHFDRLVIAAAPELLEALRVARGIVITERDAAHEGVVNQSTGVIEDPDDADWVAGYDRALQQIDAAIAKATGGAS